MPSGGPIVQHQQRLDAVHEPIVHPCVDLFPPMDPGIPRDVRRHQIQLCRGPQHALAIAELLIASVLAIGGIVVALIADALIVHTLRTTFGVRHPNTRSLLTRSKGPLRLGLIVLALSLVVRTAPITAMGRAVWSCFRSATQKIER